MRDKIIIRYQKNTLLGSDKCLFYSDLLYYYFKHQSMTNDLSVILQTPYNSREAQKGNCYLLERARLTYGTYIAPRGGRWPIILVGQSEISK